MKNIITAPERINGVDLKVDHLTYKPAKGMVIIYLHTCRIPETDLVQYYVGSTKLPLIERIGLDWNNYRYGPDSKSKLSRYLAEYGWHFITSCILCVVPEETRAQAEQEAMEKYDAINLGFNSIRAVKVNPATIITIRDKHSNGYKKNNPIVNGAEDYSLTMRHKDGSVESVTINRGLYEHFYEGRALYLDTPGLKGHVVKSIASATTGSGRTNKTILNCLAEDLELKLKFGPAGSHVLTLDNIYVVGTDLSVRIYLDQNPILIKKVSYLTFGEWDTIKD